MINWFQIPLIELEPFLSSLCGEHGNKNWFTNGDAAIKEDTKELIIDFNGYTLNIDPSGGIKYVWNNVYCRKVHIDPTYCIKMVEWEKLYPLGYHYSVWSKTEVGIELSKRNNPFDWNEPLALLPKEGTLREIRRCWMDVRQEKLDTFREQI